MVVNISKILSNAFSHSIALSLFNDEKSSELPDSLIDFYDKKINPNTLLDKELVKSYSIHDKINWSIIEKNKAIRILARDISLLYDLYEISNMQTVDMFPQTHHVENILILELR